MIAANKHTSLPVKSYSLSKREEARTLAFSHPSFFSILSCGGRTVVHLLGAISNRGVKRMSEIVRRRKGSRLSLFLDGVAHVMQIGRVAARRMPGPPSLVGEIIVFSIDVLVSSIVKAGARERKKKERQQPQPFHPLQPQQPQEAAVCVRKGDSDMCTEWPANTTRCQKVGMPDFSWIDFRRACGTEPSQQKPPQKHQKVQLESTQTNLFVVCLFSSTHVMR